jgi:HK97 family phage portal protein
MQLCWDTDTGTRINVDDNPFVTPNPQMTPFQFWEYMLWGMVGWGNGYSKIERDPYTNDITALWPLHPGQVRPTYDNRGHVIYMIGPEHGAHDNRAEKIKAKDMLHIPGMGFDGLKGKSIARLAREAIGLGLVTEKFGASFFGNNAVPGGIITHPTRLTTNAKQTLQDETEERLQGGRKARRIVVLDEGMKYTQVGIAPEDGQFLQTRRFQVREICRWLRVPPHMLYDLDEATTGNIEHQSIGFTTYSLMPWLIRIVQCCRMKTVPLRLQKRYYYKHDISNLLLMDEGNRLENYAKGRNMGLYTLNDIQRKEKRPLLPPEYGDTFLIPSTMKVYGEELPPSPVEPDIITKTMELAYSMPELTPENVEAIVLTAMPDASPELLVALKLAYENYEEPEIVPLTVVPDGGNATTPNGVGGQAV